MFPGVKQDGATRAATVSFKRTKPTAHSPTKLICLHNNFKKITVWCFVGK
jgi:hypothetical protein